MKRLQFFNCYKIDDALKSGLQAFHKEAGYPVQENNKEKNRGEALEQPPPQKKQKPLFKLVKLLTILKNIFL